MRGVGVRRVGQPRRQGQGGDQVPGRQAGQPPWRTGARRRQGDDQFRDGGDRLGHRPRQRVMPELLAGDHDIQQAGAEPAAALGHRQGGDAHPGELAPQRQAGPPGRPLAHCRAAPGASAAVSRSCTDTANCSCSADRPSLICAASSVRPHRRQPQQPLGDHRALDLVRARVDRPGQREQVAVQPAAVRRRPGRAARPGARAGPAPSRAAQRRARTRTPCPGSTPRPACRRRRACQRWRRCAAGRPARRSRRRPPGRAPRCRPGHRPAATAPTRRAAAALNRPGLRSDSPRSWLGGAHRDPPALAGSTDHVGIGHEHVVQEDLREPGLAAQLRGWAARSHRRRRRSNIR